MKLPSSSIACREAKTQGYEPLTSPFFLPDERRMLDKFQNELKGVDYVLVGSQTAPEIWRKGMLKIDERNCIPIPLDPI